jgi:hypothetical protein
MTPLLHLPLPVPLTQIAAAIAVATDFTTLS